MLIHQVLSLVADGPEMILVPGVRRITNLRHQADTAAEHALTSSNLAQRTDLAVQFKDRA
jgi:hypothetical protein